MEVGFLRPSRDRFQQYGLFADHSCAQTCHFYRLKRVGKEALVRSVQREACC
jgi:hypothetical protein